MLTEELPNHFSSLEVPAGLPDDPLRQALPSTRIGVCPANDLAQRDGGASFGVGPFGLLIATEVIWIRVGQFGYLGLRDNTVMFQPKLFRSLRLIGLAAG